MDVRYSLTVILSEAKNLLHARQRRFAPLSVTNAAPYIQLETAPNDLGWLDKTFEGKPLHDAMCASGV
jgi:hypothetical protein